MKRIDEKLEKYLNEAKPYGKPQEALFNAIQKMKEQGNTGRFELTDIVSKFPKKFHNVHFQKIMNAAKALSKKKIIEFDGISEVSIY